MRCANCDAAVPEGGKFCIECGAPAAQAATGATERLTEHAGGPTCAACGTRNPPGASFCVTCGHTLAPLPAAEPPARSLPLAPQPAPISYAPSTPPNPPSLSHTRRDRASTAAWGGISGGIFLIGIAVLAVTGWWWPGILVVLGLTSLLGGILSGHPGASRWAGIQGAVFMFGLALVAAFNLWWPGMLVLVGLMAIVGAVLRPKF